LATLGVKEGVQELVERVTTSMTKSSSNYPDKKKLTSVQDFFRYTEAEGKDNWLASFLTNMYTRSMCFHWALDRHRAITSATTTRAKSLEIGFFYFTSTHV
jgi:hypothetical protein